MSNQFPQIGDYEVLSELGRGATGIVYLGVQRSLGRQVALKILAREIAGDPELVARFQREAAIAARLRHPHIVQVYDASVKDGQCYIAMEYLGSRTLKTLIGAGPVSAQEATRLVLQLLEALEAAHALGVVHRDVKPANILLTDKGDLALTDFSVAHLKMSSKLTQTGAALGTPEYMAPEQFEGEADLRSDLYAAAAIYYELVSGKCPFAADTIGQVMKKQLMDTPPALSDIVADFSVPISDVVVRALAKDPNKRYESAAEMRAALLAASSLGLDQKVALQPQASAAKPTVQGGTSVNAADRSDTSVIRPPVKTADPDTVVEHLPKESKLGGETATSAWTSSSTPSPSAAFVPEASAIQSLPSASRATPNMAAPEPQGTVPGAAIPAVGTAPKAAASEPPRPVPAAAVPPAPKEAPEPQRASLGTGAAVPPVHRPEPSASSAPQQGKYAPEIPVSDVPGSAGRTALFIGMGGMGILLLFAGSRYWKGPAGPPTTTFTPIAKSTVNVRTPRPSGSPSPLFTRRTPETTASASPTPGDGYEIEAGKGFADLKLGDSLEELRERLGAPQDTRDDEKFFYKLTVAYYPKAVVTARKPDNEVVEVLTTSPQARLKGFPELVVGKICSPQLRDDLIAKFGKPKVDIVGELRFPEAGLTLYFGDGEPRRSGEVDPVGQLISMKLYHKNQDPDQDPLWDIFPDCGVDSKSVVVAGKGVGEVKLGDSAENVRQAWGDPAPGPNAASLWYGDDNTHNPVAVVDLGAENKVSRITVYKPQFAVSGSPVLKVGATKKAILDEMVNITGKRPEELSGMSDYPGAGICFHFDHSQLCSAISVRRPGTSR